MTSCYDKYKLLFFLVKLFQSHQKFIDFKSSAIFNNITVCMLLFIFLSERLTFNFAEGAEAIISLDRMLKIDIMVLHSIFMQLVFDVPYKIMSVRYVREILLGILKAMLVL